MLSAQRKQSVEIMNRKDLRNILESEIETGAKIDSILDMFHSEFDPVKTERDNAVNERDQKKQELELATTTIGELEQRVSDSPNFTQQIEDYKKQIEELTANRDKEKISNALELEIVKAGGKNPKAIRSLIDMETIRLEKDGSVSGASEAVQKIVESDGYMFGVKKPKEESQQKESIGYDGPKESREPAKSLGFGKRLREQRKLQEGNYETKEV